MVAKVKAPRAPKAKIEKAELADETVVYSVTDILQMDLARVDGLLKGADTMKYTFGGFWNQNSQWLVEADEESKTVLSVFIRMKGNLWGYLISSPSGSWLVLFDGDRAKINSSDMSKYKTGTSRLTLAKIKDSGATCGSFKYVTADSSWVPFDLMTMLA